jgi:alpha-L-rhamnosidase
MLGNGWYNPLPFRMWGRINLREHLTIGQPRATLQLNIEYSDGTMESIVTDESWKVDDGPIIRNSIYLGEVYDARKEQAGWDKPGFDDIGWKQAILTTESIGPLCAQSSPPIKITHSFSPVLITKSPSDAYIVDMGENFSGWITLHAQGAAGTEIKMVYGELLNPDGTLNANTAACGQIKGDKEPQIPGAPINAYQTDVFILKGEGIETYTPRFTFHGFRYVEITGYPGDLTLDFVIGHRLNSAVEDAGSFSCSNEMFNRIQDIVRRTQLSNMFSVQSDCPHRERFGYGGDIVASSEMALLNFDMEQFYAKTTRDFADAVRTNGGITETAPFVGIDDFGLDEGSGCVEWGAAYLLLQWQLYQYYGDKELLEEQYVTSKRYIELLKSSAIDNIIQGGLCDHEGLTPKSIELTGTAYYFYCVYIMMSIAMVLENASDARRYAALAEDVRKSYNARFLDAETGRYDTGTQFCQSISLFLGLVPKEQRSAALTVLIQEVEACDNHLNTGILGTKYLLDVLTNMGRPDLAYTIANQKSFPGWGYMLENGATTLWEHWEKEECTFSHNHPMFGSVSEWFYKALGGIAPHPAAKGFDKILIMPQIVGDLEWVKASYESVRGLITCEWERHGPAIKFNISIPVGATATLCLPTNIPGAVTEGRKLVSLRDGIELVRTEPGWVVYAVGSGSYTFGSVLKKV